MKPVILAAALILSASAAFAATEHDQHHEQAVAAPVPDQAVVPAPAPKTEAPKAEAPKTARAELIDAKGEPAGIAYLNEVDNGVMITLEARGLTPGEHAFHIHETGKADPPDFKSAGGHFNPGNKKHGKANPDGSHAGDLPNVFVRDNGTVRIETVATGVTLQEGAPNSLLKQGGTALVIHAAADDNKTDPAGNAGARVVAGVIKKK
jgi:Cu-Zn family superoxide dismutase